MDSYDYWQNLVAKNPRLSLGQDGKVIMSTAELQRLISEAFAAGKRDAEPVEDSLFRRIFG